MPEVQIDSVGESTAKPSTASAHKWLYRGLGSAASGLEYRHNKEREVLSLKGPTPADEALNAQLLDELRRNGAYEEDAKDAVRESALHSVETVVSQWVVAQSEKMGQPVEPGEACRIVPFGSYCLGVHSADSDIDVLCIVPTHISRHDFFSDVPPLLAAQSNIANVHSVPEAFVPVIKFECDAVDFDLSMAHVPYASIPADLSVLGDEHLKELQDPKDVTCLNGPRVTLEILRRVPHVENFRTFLRCIKLWARRRGIYSNIVGFPGGVAWAIMAAMVAQYYPNMNPVMLFEKFFFIYHVHPLYKKFNNPVKIAPIDECIAPPGAVYMKSWSQAEPLRPVCVITPTYPPANATFNASHSTLKVMKKEIENAHLLMQSILKGKGTLSQVFEHADFLKTYTNYVQVEATAANQEAIKAELLKSLYIVTLYGGYARALTFVNLQSPGAGTLSMVCKYYVVLIRIYIYLYYVHTYTHTHTLTHSLTLTHSYSLTHSFSHTHSPGAGTLSHNCASWSRSWSSMMRPASTSRSPASRRLALPEYQVFTASARGS